MEDISCVVLTRNEAKTLPKLIQSLKGITDIVVVDTGSTDDTVKIAKELGCRVFETGDQFRIEPSQQKIDQWKTLYKFDPSFKVGEKYFHYANARNYGAQQAKNDWIFQVDADEEVNWDLAKVRDAIQHEDHFVYRFCYQHNADGTCGLELEQSKIYRKSKLRWEKWIHEVLQAIPGQSPKPPKSCDFIYHHHWQNKESLRSHYLPGLEMSILENSKDDRNLYYLAREYYWTGKYDYAIFFFKEYLTVGKWLPERSQTYVFMGDCYKAKKEFNTAIECYHNAMANCGSRREPFWNLATLYEQMKDIKQAIIYLEAAMAIPFQPQGYLNSMELYGWLIPDRLALFYSQLGKHKESKKWWLESLKCSPDRRILGNVNWFYKDNLPLISIVVPTCRPEGFARLEKSIKENTVYPNYQIIKIDGEGTAVDKFNAGVKSAKGEFIVYIADDCEVKLGWLTQAYTWFKEHFRDRGLVIFNDAHWNGTIANHFLCSKNIREELDGEIWSSEYKHCSVDIELYCRLKAKDLVEYCEEAQIIHHHYFANSRGATKNPKDEWNIKVENKYTYRDRLLLPKRLRKLGLEKDAWKYYQWFMDLLVYPSTHESYDLKRIFFQNNIWPDEYRVLNIGVGTGESGVARQLPSFPFKKLTHVDIHAPYLENAKKTKWQTKEVEYRNEDIRKIWNFKDFDLILAFDVLEHLPKKDVLNLLEKWENKKVIIFGPLENEFRPNTFGAESQDHLSLWTEDDFKKLGFKTELLKGFHHEKDKIWDALWAIKA